MNFSKTLLQLLFFAFFPCLAAQGQGWERTFGGPEPDLARAGTETTNGDLIITGQRGDALLTFRTNIRGEILWEEIYSPKGVGNDLITTSAGDFLIAGREGEDYLLCLVDPAGVVLWQKVFGTGAEEILNGVDQAADGGYILTGSIATAGPDSRDISLIKTDREGQLEWERQFGGEGEDWGQQVRSTPDGGYVLSTRQWMDGTVVTSIIKTDRAGVEEWTYRQPAEAEGAAQNLLVDPDGSIYFLDNRPHPEPPHAISPYLHKLNSDGQLGWTQHYGDAQIRERGYALAPGKDSGFLLSSSSEDELLLLLTDGEGQVQSRNSYGAGNGNTELAPAVQLVSDGGFLALGQSQDALNPNDSDIFVLRSDPFGNTAHCLIEGAVWFDQLTNCQLDNGENGLEGWTIQAAGGNITYSTNSDAAGRYSLLVEVGTYQVTAYPPNTYWTACNNPTNSLTLNSYDTVRVDFPGQGLVDCPNLLVDVSTPFLEDCAENTYTVTYSNQGPTRAEAAYLELTFGAQLLVQSSSLLWSEVEDGTYTFELGDLAANSSGSFTVLTQIDCANAVLGQTHCVEAHLYPDSVCNSLSPDWDRSDIVVDGICDNDSVRFEIRNVGTGGSVAPIPYQIIEDHIVIRSGTHQLPPGGIDRIVVRATGETMRLETEQSIGHPIGNRPAVSVEGCNASSSGNYSLGFLNQLEENDLAPFRSIDCQQSVGSPAELDKRAFPEGYKEKHLISETTDLEYLIHFQNTGSDTAYRLVVLDTLSPFLNPLTAVAGAGSHPYRMELIDERTLRFTFTDIRLPSRNDNERASHGFVKFRVKQRTDNENDTQINNSAAIYLNYERPIISNRTFNLVTTECFLEDGCIPTSTTKVPEAARKVRVDPNPFYEWTSIHLDAPTAELRFYLYDRTGRELRRELHRGDRFRFDRKALAAGLYFFRLETAEGRVHSGKLLIQ
ncbi:MAG: hypothetical protein AAFW73_05730 [Bacteroidota bacterium]